MPIYWSGEANSFRLCPNCFHDFVVKTVAPSPDNLKWVYEQLDKFERSADPTALDCLVRTLRTYGGTLPVNYLSRLASIGDFVYIQHCSDEDGITWDFNKQISCSHLREEARFALEVKRPFVVLNSAQSN